MKVEHVVNHVEVQVVAEVCPQTLPVLQQTVMENGSVELH